MIDHVYEVIWSVASWLQVSPPYNISDVPPSPGYLKGKQWEGSTLLRESHNNHLKLKVSIFDDDNAELILWYGRLAEKVQPGALLEIYYMFIYYIPALDELSIKFRTKPFNHIFQGVWHKKIKKYEVNGQKHAGLNLLEMFIIRPSLMIVYFLKNKDLTRTRI